MHFLTIDCILLLFAAGILYSNAFSMNQKWKQRTTMELYTFTEPVTNLEPITESEVNKEPWKLFTTKFIDGWSRSLKGNISSLDSLLSSTTLWDNPYVSTSIELREGLQKFSEFFEDPALIVFNTKLSGSTQITIDYQISFWYPAPWRPRIIIPATALVVTSPDFKNIISVSEKWDVTIPQIFLKQFLPRFWDVWHVFCSPSPEIPPEKLLGSKGKVIFAEIPNTVAIEVTWTGLAKYTGPPLLTVPGFSLIGELQTSRPNRDKYYTILPVEVQSSRYLSVTGEDMKRSSWIFHVPTACQHQVMEKALTAEEVSLSTRSEEESESDLVDELDYTVGLENLSVMKSVTAGAVRADFEVNQPLVDEFVASERKGYKYKFLPKRTVAQIEIYGEATSEKIGAAIQEIKAAVEGDKVKSNIGNENIEKVNLNSVMGGVPGSSSRWRVKPISSVNLDKVSSECGPDTNQLGLQLCYVKGCFNMRGEPAMAIYEMQYSRRLTKVFLELEEVV